MNFRIVPAALAVCAFAFAAQAQTGSMSGPSTGGGMQSNHVSSPTGCPGTQNHMAGGAMAADNHMAGGTTSGGTMAGGDHMANSNHMAGNDHMAGGAMAGGNHMAVGNNTGCPPTTNK